VTANLAAADIRRISRAMAAASDHHEASPVFQSAGVATTGSASAAWSSAPASSRQAAKRSSVIL
jgi:hypothetical protein